MSTQLVTGPYTTRFDPSMSFFYINRALIIHGEDMRRHHYHAQLWLQHRRSRTQQDKKAVYKSGKVPFVTILARVMHIGILLEWVV